MRVRPTELPGVLILEPVVRSDARGHFAEVFHASRYRDAGIDAAFVQDNWSRSARGVVRGMHFQEPQAQGKLVTVLRGTVYDVVLDVRRGSPTFGRWVSAELNDRNAWQLWIPPGFAHGFQALEDHSDVLYKCTDFYAPGAERCVRWDDPAVAIHWPLHEAVVSPKDAVAPRLSECEHLPRFEPPR